MESGIQLKEFEILLVIGIRKPESKTVLEYTVHGAEEMKAIALSNSLYVMQTSDIVNCCNMWILLVKII